MTTSLLNAYRTQLPQLLQNGVNLARNYLYTLSQNHGSLKTNVLVLSSLILVMSRIAISMGSAKRAEGTPDGPFRYREAIRTFIREAAGWTLSFLVLRAIETGVKAGIRSMFKISLNPDPVLLSNAVEKHLMAHELKGAGLFRTAGSLVKQGWDFLRGRTLAPVTPLKAPYYGSSFFHFDVNNPLFKKLEGFIGLFSGGRPVSAEEKMRNFYRWFPILVGSVPAIGLSGYALERFNLNHSQDIINALAARKQQKNGLSPSQPVGQAPLSGHAVPVQPAVLDQSARQVESRFHNYLNRVYSQQISRGTFPG
jgi:hypothetical protein